MSAGVRSGIASRHAAAVVIVDVQEKLMPTIRDRERLERRIVQLLRGAKILGLPALVTEQYKKGLGGTVAAVAEAAAGARFLEKTTFSCLGDAAFAAALRDSGRTQVIVAGVEAHICVLQTCLDARSLGLEVYLAADAIGTRLEHTLAIGVDRAKQSGAWVTSVEGVLFECMERCDSDAFKAMLPLVRDGV